MKKRISFIGTSYDLNIIHRSTPCNVIDEIDKACNLNAETPGGLWITMRTIYDHGEILVVFVDCLRYRTPPCRMGSVYLLLPQADGSKRAIMTSAKTIYFLIATYSVVKTEWISEGF